MLKRLGAYLVLAISCAVEVYLLFPDGYDVFHGGFAHTFLGVLGVIGLPVINVLSIWNVFFRKRKRQVSASDNQGNIGDIEEDVRKRRKNYISLLKELPNSTEFAKDINICKDQIIRFERYLSKIREICVRLNQRDKVNTAECERAIEGAISIFYRRIEAMMACIRMFDVDEYHAFRSGELELKSPESVRAKEELFNHSFNEVDKVTDLNEEMILVVQKLLASLTRIGASKEWDDETILETKRLNDYIKSTEEAIALDSEVGETVLRYYSSSDDLTMQLGPRK